MPNDELTGDELTMCRFILMGQQSLSPHDYDDLLLVCRRLCLARRRSLRLDSMQRCLDSIKRGDHQEAADA